jgi:UDP-N-acetylmuramoylalanine--D-glutamate ligase
VKARLSKCKSVAILGFGVEGKSTLEWLRSFYTGEVLISDIKKPEHWDDYWHSSTNIKTAFGENYIQAACNCDAIIRTAGIKPTHSALVEFAQNKLLTSQTEIFIDAAAHKTIGVTGTMGKGTTCAILQHALVANAIKCVIAGNFGVPFLEVLADLDAYEYIIAELSSFQLSTLKKSPKLAIVLHTSQEHLNWHSDLQDYWQCKANLVKWQEDDGLAVIHSGSEGADWIATCASAKILRVGASHACDTVINTQQRTINLLHKYSVDYSQFALEGAFQGENIGAALTLLANLKDFDIAKATNALSTFKGLEYRLQYVGARQGISFYNDSYATRPEATIAAVQSFTKPIALILGGSSKNADFTELAQALATATNIAHISLIGETAKEIIELLDKHPQNIKKSIYLTFEEAIDACVKSLENGVVLLSPACASFGMFNSYKERGQKFNFVVQKYLV